MPPSDFPEYKPTPPSDSPGPSTEDSTEPENPKPSDAQGLRKFIKKAKRDAQRGGDVNVAQVGEGAQVDQIAVGRNILQAKINIGSLVIPVRFIAVLVLLALIAGGIAWYVLTPDKMPASGNSFNIAVADFGTQDAQGNVTSSADASSWSKWMFNTLRDEAQQLPADRKLVIWHNSISPWQERAQIGVIQGKTADERSMAAAKKAQELGADLIIYGNFSMGQTPALFVPDFYLAKGRDEADEMRGSQEMGKAFPAPAPLDPADPLTNEYLNTNLKPRAAALVWFVRGLIADLTGNFEKAYQLFGDGLTQVKDLRDDQGKPVFDYYLGREALFLSQDDNRARAFFGSTDTALARAEDGFRAAIRLDPNYARAYFGLGNTFFQRANLILTNTAPNAPERAQVPALLAQARQYHQQALDLAQNAPGSLIDLKSRVQLGFDDYQEGRNALDENKYGDAEQLLQNALKQLQVGLTDAPTEQHRLRAQIYLGLATTSYKLAEAHAAQDDAPGARQNFNAADKAFDGCILEANALVQDAYLQNLKTTLCESGKQDVKAALAKMN